jgi:hypothetical protein
MTQRATLGETLQTRTLAVGDVQMVHTPISHGKIRVLVDT